MTGDVAVVAVVAVVVVVVVVAVVAAVVVVVILVDVSGSVTGVINSEIIVSIVVVVSPFNVGTGEETDKIEKLTNMPAAAVCATTLALAFSLPDGLSAVSMAAAAFALSMVTVVVACSLTERLDERSNKVFTCDRGTSSNTA